MAEQGAGGISWTDVTWNPIRGCSRVSEGCRHCYAERHAFRFSGPGMPYEGLVRVSRVGVRRPEWNGVVRVIEEHLLDPLRWRTPRRVFVNSMSDLFHESVSDATLDRIFAVMALAPAHTFQVLTKRPERMQTYLSFAVTRDRVFDAAAAIVEGPEWRNRSLSPTPFRWIAPEGLANVPGKAFLHEEKVRWPLPNVWLGVSVEDQAAADARIPLLLQTPAAVRWISAEPLLGALDLGRVRAADDAAWYRTALSAGDYWESEEDEGSDGPERPWLDWVVVGGESGPGARPMAAAWARSLRDQCVAAAVPFHFKQWGEWLPGLQDGAPGDDQHLNCSDAPVRMGKHKAGRLLDGRTWDEWPA